MSSKVKIALVGRPNVGKSALFNRICKKRISIVDEMEGVTRDRLYADAELFGREFEMIDTGGIDPRSTLPFNELVRRQAEIAIEEADGIIMVVDSRIGITALDEEVAALLLKHKKPIALAVNKVDKFDDEHLVHEFHSLGIEKMVAVSAVHGFQIAELLEEMLTDLPEGEVIENEEIVNVAIIGRPNVGKSTLVNYLLDEERCVVSPIAGTTRDSIDVMVRAGGTTYRLIDTAGIRRKSSEHEVVDKFAAIRTERAIDRSDVCVLMLDSQEGLTSQERKIATMISEKQKGCIILFNKWDTTHSVRMEHCKKSIEIEAPFVSFAPMLFASSKTGQNVDKLFPTIDTVYGAYYHRVGTGRLNSFLEDAMQRVHPPMIKGKRLRVFYMAQVSVAPPRFVQFVNYSDLMTSAYQKYLINKFREKHPFPGVTLNFSLKQRKRV